MYTEKCFYRKVETSNVLFFSSVSANTKGPLNPRSPQQTTPRNSLLKRMGPTDPSPPHVGQWKGFGKEALDMEHC